MAPLLAPLLAPRGPKTAPRRSRAPLLTCGNVRPLGFEPRTCGLRVLAQPSFLKVTPGLNGSFAVPRVPVEAHRGPVWRELLPKELPNRMGSGNYPVASALEVSRL